MSEDIYSAPKSDVGSLSGSGTPAKGKGWLAVIRWVLLVPAIFMSWFALLFGVALLSKYVEIENKILPYVFIGLISAFSAVVVVSVSWFLAPSAKKLTAIITYSVGVVLVLLIFVVIMKGLRSKDMLEFLLMSLLLVLPVLSGFFTLKYFLRNHSDGLKK